jgi:23S rRNA (adenine2030-N6)-methyltransferase
LLQQPEMPALVTNYLDCVQTNNGPGPLVYYPGSPCIAKQFLRQQDRMVLCELHQEEWQQLKILFSRDKQVAVHHQDGYQGLKAFLPPEERRGFVLIDPPYEKPDEFSHLITALSSAVKRWETGTYALWYPIKEKRSIERFHQSLKQKIHRPILIAELSVYPENTALHLNGSGMFIVNPPWQLHEKLKEILPWLWHVLTHNHQGRWETTQIDL